MNQNLATEKQNVEFKESWRDEYLKWICGFANTQGGTLYIGVKDNGEVCGVENPKRLMEEIPNKARDVMGVFVEVNLLTENGLDYLEIKTEKYSFPVSYRGKFYRRCGATNQELKGAAMYRFLLRSQNLTWDKQPEPKMTREKVIDACKENDFPSPIAYTQGSGLWVVFNYSDAYVNKLSAIDKGEKIWFDPENGMGSSSSNEADPQNKPINGTIKAADPQNVSLSEEADPQNETIKGTTKATDPQNVSQSEDADPQNETINSTNETIKYYDVEKLKEEVIKIVKEDSTITKEEMAKKIGISRSTLQRALRKIPNLTFVGASKSGHWEIKIN